MLRRRVWAATASAPYSMKLPPSHRSRDVLARGAAARGMAPRDGLRPVGVEREGVAIDHALQVGAYRRRDRPGPAPAPRQRRRRPVPSTSRICSSPRYSPGVRTNFHDAPAAGGVQHVFHLHRLEHGDLRSGSHPSARHARPVAPGAPPSGARTTSRPVLRPCFADGVGLVRAGADSCSSAGSSRFQEARCGSAGCELGPCGQGLQQAQVGGQPVDTAFGQGPPRPAHGIGERRAARVDDQLGQQRVVVRRGRGARDPMRVDADARAAGQLEARQRAAGRAGVALGVQGLGVDAPLDRKALRRRRVLPGPARASQASARQPLRSATAPGRGR